jgi:methionine-rich copper-binding protein CopC
VTNDFRLYTWDGKAEDAPVELDNNLDALLKATGGSFESIVSPASIKPGTQIQLLQDNGDTIWAGQTAVSKDLDPADQQFKGNIITLGSPVVDHTPPTLVTASPADDSTGVAVSSTLSLTFDEGVAFGTGTIELKDANDVVVQTFKAGDAGVKVDYNTITLQPTNKLSYTTGYKVVLNDNAVTDHSGNALPAKTIDFTTGTVPHYDVLISEVNSSAVGGDFFEIYNYGTTTIDLSGWKMTDDAHTFSGAKALPANLTLEAGKTLVVSVDATQFDNFKTVWNLTTASNVIGIDGPGLGKQDAVILFDANGNMATAFNYSPNAITASDGTVIATSTATNTYTANQHAGAAYGSTATASAVWDGVSTSNPHYVGAVAGQLGSVSEANSASSVGSPGYVPIVQTGTLSMQPDASAL